MASELEKLGKAIDQIKRDYPSNGKRYSTIVENPFESGYWPLPKPSKAAIAARRKLLKDFTAK